MSVEAGRQSALQSSAKPGWMGYDEPEGADSIPRLNIDEVYNLMHEQSPGLGFQLVDVRRADLSGHMLKDSVNLPAHTFFPSRQILASMLGAVPTIIVYCGSSRGRGPRCAAWLRDALLEQTSGEAIHSKVYVMKGGSAEFVKKYGEDLSVVVKLPSQVQE